MASEKGRREAVAAVGAAVFSLLWALGRQAEETGGCALPAVLRSMLIALIPAWIVLKMLFAIKLPPPRKASRPIRPGRAWLLMMACYLPMYAVLFPGSFCYDVPFQLEQVFTGSYSTHHPLLHTLMLGMPVWLGRQFGDITLGAAAYTLMQMALLALCFVQTACSVERVSGTRAARLTLLFFALYPLHMCFAVTATKDVLFSGCFVLFTALVREQLTNGRTDQLRGIQAVLAGAAAILLRNNMLYALLAFIPTAVLLCGREARRAVCCCMAALILGAGGNAVLASVLHAQPGDMREMLSVPIQQMARARLLYGERLNEEEKAVIDGLLPENAWQAYEPMIADPVKFGFDTEALKADPAKALSVYLSVGKKCPDAYADAAVMLTYSFFYPYREYRVPGYYLQMGMGGAEYDAYYDWCDFERIEERSLLPAVQASLKWRFGAKGGMQMPVIGYAFNMGCIIWAMLALMLRACYRKERAAQTAGLLPILLWATFLLGPVMAGRYAYPFACVLPVLAFAGGKEPR